MNVNHAAILLAAIFYEIYGGVVLDIIQKVWEIIVKSFQSFTDLWIFKTAISMILAFVLGNFGVASSSFIMLIIIDLATKWLALSYKCLIDNGTCQANAGLYECMIRMHDAAEKGYIRSGEMKHRFAGKIILYMVVTFMAIHVDNMIGAANQSVLFLNMAWFYFGATEAISILENLRDAGVSSIEPLLTFIRNKLGSVLGSNKNNQGGNQ